MVSDEPGRPAAQEGPLSAGFEMRYERGEKGQQGDKGDKGESSTRLPAMQARAVVYLFALNVLFFAACFIGLIHYVHSGDQERCTTLEQTVSIPVPHPLAGNPSREFDARFEAIERERGRQLGCRP